MAVRFSASGQDYTRTLTAGTLTQISLAMWLKVSVDRNTMTAFWSIGNSGAGYILGTPADGTTVTLIGDNPSIFSFSATVGTWYYVAFSVNGVNGTYVRRSLGDASFTTGTFATGNTSGPGDTLWLGTNPFAEWVNGCLAAVKMWLGATLTQAELEAEAWSQLPRRTTNLRCWYPFVRAETVDYSGQAQTLSGGTGAATEDGPGVAWGLAAPIRPRRESVSADATVTPSVVAALAAIPAPTLSAGSAVSPATVAATAAIPAPSAGAGATTSPATVAATAAVAAPGVSAGSSATPQPVPAVAAVPAPGLSAGSTAAPQPVAAVATVPSAALSTGATASAATVNASAAVHAPAVSTATLIAPAVVAATTAVPAPALSTSAGVTPVPVAASATVPAVALSAGTTVGPQAVSGLAAVPAPVVASVTLVAPPTVAAVVSLPPGGISTGGTVSPAAVAALAAVPAPTVTGSEPAGPTRGLMDSHTRVGPEADSTMRTGQGTAGRDRAGSQASWHTRGSTSIGGGL